MIPLLPAFTVPWTRGLPLHITLYASTNCTAAPATASPTTASPTTASLTTASLTTASPTTASPTTASSSKPSTITPSFTTARTGSSITTSTTSTTKEQPRLPNCATCASTAYESHIILPCTHSYCPACFTNLITTSLSPSNLTSEFPPKCPLAHSYTPEKRPHPPAIPNPAVPLITSNEAIPPQLIKTHCPAKVYTRQRFLEDRLAISPDRSWYCPNPPCGALSDRWRMRKLFSAVRCRKCKSWGCVKCEKRRRLPGWHWCKGKPWEVDPEKLARGLRIVEEEERLREARRKLEGFGPQSEEEGSESESESEGDGDRRSRVKNEVVPRKEDGSD